MKRLFDTRRRALCAFGVLVIAAIVAVPLAWGFNPDTLVTVGSPTSPFSENKQNEPALAVDANDPNMLVAGANDEIDMEACNAGDDTTCPFTPGVGTSGVYFSFDSGTTWTQPTYSGLTGRVPGVVGDRTRRARPTTGPIGTLPNYSENGLVSDGDPAVAFGPRPARAASRGQRLAPLLREPDRERRRDAQRADVQGLRGDRRLAHRRRPGCGRGDATRLVGSGARDLEAVVDDVHRQGADLGGQRRRRARSSGPSMSAGPTSAAATRSRAADGGRLARRRRHVDAASAHRGRQQRSEQPADGCTVRTDSRERRTSSASARSPRRAPGVRAMSRSLTAVPPGRRPCRSSARSPSRGSSTRSSVARRSTASRARAATSPPHRAWTSQTAPPRAAMQPTASS